MILVGLQSTVRLALVAALSAHSASRVRGITRPCSSDSTAFHDFLTRYRTSLPPRLTLERGALVVVCDGDIAFAEGFGKTAAGDPVDPARTIFRAASNSKLIATTAVMQLADRGAWSLSDDVNRYLPPPARLAPLSNAGPVTLAHLLTHTAGFEDKFAGGVVIPADRLTLAAFFARHRPERATPPGREVSYSNIGMALAGYLVEVRTGEPFARYAERHIFAPLGMTRSSFDQPPPTAWARDLAGGPPRGRYDVVFNPYPAASLVTTPMDMGRFIAAHLTRVDTTSTLGTVLSSTAMALMHASHWRAQPSVPGVAYGFFEGVLNGHRTLFHTGDSGDHSLVLLLPDERFGVYFVFSGTDEQTAARDRFARELVDAFFPAQREALRPQPIATSSGSVPVAAIVGVYRNTAYSRSNYEKARALFAQVSVRGSARGTLLVTPPGGAAPIELERSGALTFRRDSGEAVALRQSADGKVIGFTLSGLIWDPSSWDRIAWWEDRRVHLDALGVSIVLLLARLAWSPVTWVIRRVRGGERPARSPSDRRLWRWSGLVAGAFFLSPIVALATAFLSFSHPLRAVPRAVAVLTTLLLLSVTAGVALVPAAIMARKAQVLRPTRIAIALTGIACVTLAIILGYWRLLAPWSLG